jgi:2-polyprenyl-3-methyl-5-hydroxy-6-metoxy-1,4-benzoquinol methylase
MLVDSGVARLGPTTWADLGCGEGTFTRALAGVLAAGSVIHAMDVDAAALRRIPAEHNGVRIITHHRDFMKQPWPFKNPDGVLMANSLHYVENQAAFIHVCETRMKPRRYFFIVEYDTNAANRWVPYPVSRATLTSLFQGAGYSSVTMLGTRQSIYRRAPLYAAIITSD